MSKGSLQQVPFSARRLDNQHWRKEAVAPEQGAKLRESCIVGAFVKRESFSLVWVPTLDTFRTFAGQLAV